MSVATRRLIFLLAVTLMGSAALIWLCRTSPKLRFLPSRTPAEWIVYPNPPEMGMRYIAESSAVFRREFSCDTAPAGARLTLSAFRVAKISINGNSVELPSIRNWKQPVEAHLPLRSGENQLLITISNSNAPPALWAVLRAGTQQIRTDTKWQVSWAGAVWRPARLAREPMPVGPGNPILGGEQPLKAMAKLWLPLLLITALITATIVLFQRRFAVFPSTAPNLALGLFIALWVALFANNVFSLPRLAGFDVDGHIQYVQYLLTQGSLPQADEGWEMFQPPLYYMLSAAGLGLLGLSPDDTGVLFLRFVGLAIAIAQLVFVRNALRLLFPEDPKKQIVGLTLAAFLPAQLYLSHFVTNETLAAVLVTASLWLCLRILRHPSPTWTSFLALGLCLGAALLSKLTAVLAIPFVLAALLMRAWNQPLNFRGQWLLRVTAVLALSLLVGGWHYARLWANYGSPLVGNWDAVLGFDWWQDEGYRTAPYFLRFGAALTQPWYSVFNSLPNGLYSTLWGDGVWSGATELYARMPWNYSWMAAGYLLALIPTLLLLAGAFAALARLVRTTKPEYILLVGYVAVAVAAMIGQSLNVPYSSTVKAFYFLSALLPLCALAALGWDVFARRTRTAAAILAVTLTLWASVSYGSYWIRHDTSSAETVGGLDHFEHNRHPEAIDCFRRAINADSANLPARSLLAQSLLRLGRIDESLEIASATSQQFPNGSASYIDSAAALAGTKRWHEAIAQARHAVALAPDDSRAHVILTAVLELSGNPADLEQASREALRVSPTNPTFHRQLALALAAQARSTATTNVASVLGEAREHLLLAIRLADAAKQTTVSAAARQLLDNLSQPAAPASN